MGDDGMTSVQAILAAGVVGFAFDAPRTFKSGLKSPVYLDNRRLLTHPHEWHIVIRAMAAIVDGLGIPDPVIAGVETAGIPHSSALAYKMRLPTVFVRKQAKEHGLQQRIEGGDVYGRSVVLIEDQITTGGSSLSGVMALRDAGATVDHLIAITSYSLPEAADAFEHAGVKLHVMVSFADLLPAIRSSGRLNELQSASLERWLANPAAWTE
jgi:orotate phosphoribosyltransferase